MAVEDAGSLGVLLGPNVRTSEVPDRLRLFQNLRSHRNCAMQILSNWAVEGYDAVFKKADPYLDGVKLGECGTPCLFFLSLLTRQANRNELNIWTFEHDVQKEAVSALG